VGVRVGEGVSEGGTVGVSVREAVGATVAVCVGEGSGEAVQVGSGVGVGAMRLDPTQLRRKNPEIQKIKFSSLRAEGEAISFAISPRISYEIASSPLCASSQ
jgi:hypothetical protein